MRRYRPFTLAFCAMLLCVLLAAPACAEAAPEPRGIAFVRNKTLPIWASPDTGGEILFEAAQGEVLILLEQERGWCKVLYNLCQGYVPAKTAQFLSRENVELGFGEVISSGSLSSKADVQSGALCSLYPGDRCYIIGLNTGFYKVLYGEKTGYVPCRNLRLTQVPRENQASTQEALFFRLGKTTGLPARLSLLHGQPLTRQDGSPVTGQDIVQEAAKHLGCPYVRGGEGPNRFDCSGLVYYSLGCLGFSSARSVADQTCMGSRIDLLSDMLPGDLVFFATGYGKTPTHVGIYAGDGQFLHAPNSRSTVRYDDLTTGYWGSCYLFARRMV